MTSETVTASLSWLPSGVFGPHEEGRTSARGEQRWPPRLSRLWRRWTRPGARAHVTPVAYSEEPTRERNGPCSGECDGESGEARTPSAPTRTRAPRPPSASIRGRLCLTRPKRSRSTRARTLVPATLLASSPTPLQGLFRARHRAAKDPKRLPTVERGPTQLRPPELPALAAAAGGPAPHRWPRSV